LQIRNRLAEAEEIDSGISLSNGLEEVENAPESTNSEKRELTTSVSESGTECESHLSV
jgi:hypothetical protein